MGAVVGYMVTWGTYGSWLQGDERGYVKDGERFGANVALERANRELLKRDVVVLDEGECEVVRKAILAEADRIGEKILALSVSSRHVHVVAAGGGEGIGKVVSRFKCAVYYEVKKSGVRGRLWGRGYHGRRGFDEEGLLARVRDFEGHTEGNPQGRGV